MYRVSAQGVAERMINVYDYHYHLLLLRETYNDTHKESTNTAINQCSQKVTEGLEHLPGFG